MGIFENKSSESSLTGSPYTSTSPTQSSKHSTDIVSSSPDISVDLEENDNNNEINLINKSMEKEIAQISSSSTSSPTSSSDEINISDKIHNKKYQRKHISSEAKHVFDEAKFNLEKLTLIDELDNQHIAPLVKNVKDNYEYALNVIKKPMNVIKNSRLKVNLWIVLCFYQKMIYLKIILKKVEEKELYATFLVQNLLTDLKIFLVLIIKMNHL
ncbi:hypothetical protein NAPIS_ORF00368 [Vairimorpha apis BRL 01]|uniref:Uncharacterized protein n=1 Tax=Vairimorpha apis BRL 01 TaxID=1037528 RepID=T0LCM1_9MICR|nr:hypothetical protein NAPIS_ORF00368 [Vairimorpha apis BRL 01]